MKYEIYIRKRNCLKVKYSLRKHRHELSVLLNENSIDAIGLCETRLDTKVTDSNVLIAGYRIFRNDRDLNGGVAVYKRGFSRTFRKIEEQHP